MSYQSKSRILDLLYGNLFTYSERIENDEEGIKNAEEAIKAEIAIDEKIKDNPELTELFEQFMNKTALKEISQTDLFFTEGFKTGLLIGIEAGEWASRKK